MRELRDWVLARLRERSTWRGVVLGLVALGVTLSPETKEAIVSLGLAVAGVVEVAWPKGDGES